GKGEIARAVMSLDVSKINLRDIEKHSSGCWFYIRHIPHISEPEIMEQQENRAEIEQTFQTHCD
ncbi:MAG: hypothetical protein V2I33_25655, partial [Kangiellaceae bacterium]|nr:hypothetical protein [Kangiellaceae bacterium]